MAIITLTSASGSPGVTTTALGLALVWPRPVLLVEADPTGGSALLAGYWRGQLDHVGLLDLVLAERHGLLADALPRMQLAIGGSDASVLVGTKSHEQAGSLARLWDPLLGVLQELPGQDVIVDAGRLGLDGSRARCWCTPMSPCWLPIRVCGRWLLPGRGRRLWRPMWCPAMT